jgi:hypothetical protein
MFNDDFTNYEFLCAIPDSRNIKHKFMTKQVAYTNMNSEKKESTPELPFKICSKKTKSFFFPYCYYHKHNKNKYNNGFRFASECISEHGSMCDAHDIAFLKKKYNWRSNQKADYVACDECIAHGMPGEWCLNIQKNDLIDEPKKTRNIISIYIGYRYKSNSDKFKNIKDVYWRQDSFDIVNETNSDEFKTIDDFMKHKGKNIETFKNLGEIIRGKANKKGKKTFSSRFSFFNKINHGWPNKQRTRSGNFCFVQQLKLHYVNGEVILETTVRKLFKKLRDSEYYKSIPPSKHKKHGKTSCKNYNKRYEDK